MTLSRKTPLRAKTPLKTTAPLAQMSAKKRAQLAADGVPPTSTLARSREPKMAAPKPARRTPAVPADVRAALRERSGGWCEIRMVGCRGQGTDPSHRITTKNGGRKGAAKAAHDRPSNVLWACRSCHDWVGANPAASKVERVGWALEEWQDPARCPALYRGVLVWLADDGRVLAYEDGAA